MLEYVLRPRIAFLHGSCVFRQAAGAMIMISGFLLLLPLPIPYTNFFPAVCTLLFAAGSLERDGIFFLGGCVMFVLSIAFFSFLGFGGVHAFDGIRHFFQKS